MAYHLLYGLCSSVGRSVTDSLSRGISYERNLLERSLLLSASQVTQYKIAENNLLSTSYYQLQDVLPSSIIGTRSVSHSNSTSIRFLSRWYISCLDQYSFMNVLIGVSYKHLGIPLSSTRSSTRDAIQSRFFSFISQPSGASFFSSYSETTNKALLLSAVAVRKYWAGLRLCNSCHRVNSSSTNTFARPFLSATDPSDLYGYG